MLPYHSSSSVFIRTSAYRNGDRISEFSLGNTVTVLFHFLYCNQGLADNFKFQRRLLIHTCLVGRCEEHRLEHLAHHSVFVAIHYALDRRNLNSHLHEIDAQANEMLETIIPRLADERGINEDLKARDMLRWVAEMNNIKASAEEIVLREVVLV